MPQKKIKLMFDATIFFNAINKGSNRSGIFFTAYQVAKRLAKHPDVDLLFYCSPNKIKKLLESINEELPEFKNVPFYYEKHNYVQQKRDFYKYVKKEAKERVFFILAFLFHYARFFYSIISYIFNMNIEKNTSEFSVNAYLSPMSCFPQKFLFGDIKKYIILHDVIPLKFPKYFPDVKKGDHWLLRVINQLKNYHNCYGFTNSKNTKDDFLQYIPDLKSEKIIVTPLAAGDSFNPCSKEDTIKSLKKYGLPTNKKYVFSLCSLEPRKNLIRAVKTFVQFIEKNQINDLVFILGGGHWKEFIGKLDAELGKIPEGLVIKAGYIDDEDLAPLYSGAEWFVYTSQYEGFGLPPLEAMQCGCPVITSNNSSLPEVVGDAGIMIDWDSDEQHIKAYEDYYFNPELREQMRQRGLERAKQFSWDKTVDLMIKEMMK